MRRPARPRSAGSQGAKRGASTDGAAAGRPPSAGRDRGSTPPSAAGPAPSSGRPSSKQRPRSAQAQRAAVSAGEKALQALQEQCLELKRTANTLNEENTKTKTRHRVLERELQRRERLLRQLAMIKKAGQCIDMDLIEKLREERNMLPIVRKRAQELLLQIEDKDTEIRELKRHPQFTRIIELQVEFATWQHEANRLDSLLHESSPEANNVARQEIEVHERRVGQLEDQLAAAGEKNTKVAADLEEMEGDHGGWLQQYEEKEKELKRQQDVTRELAIAFKKVLQERAQVEKLQEEIDEMNLANKRFDDESESSSPQAAKQSSASPAKVPATPSLGRTSVTQAARSRDLLDKADRTARTVLPALRRAAASRAGESSLFAEFLQRDTDNDGLLSMDELAEAMAAVDLGNCTPEDLSSLRDLAPATSSSAQAGAGGAGGVRWLDLLVLLDRSATTAPLPPALPSVAPLRAACLRSELDAEEFRRGLCESTGRQQAEAFFSGLGLETSVTEMWVAAWETYGPDGLLLRLPMGDVAICQADFDAWFARCVDAVRLHRKDLVDSFQVWRQDMLLQQEQFNTVCLDVLGLQLSQDDIGDLALFVSGGSGGPIDGGAVLKIEELRKLGAR